MAWLCNWKANRAEQGCVCMWSISCRSWCGSLAAILSEALLVGVVFVYVWGFFVFNLESIATLKCSILSYQQTWATRHKLWFYVCVCSSAIGVACYRCMQFHLVRVLPSNLESVWAPSQIHFAFTPLDSSFPTAQNSVCMCEGTDAVDFR